MVFLKKNFRFLSAFLITAIILPLCIIFGAVRAEANQPLLFEIRIPMKAGAFATVTDETGKISYVGQVKALPVKTRWPSYSASAWSTPGSVCASAVNAIHMLVSTEKGKGRTLSIIPKDTIAPAAGPGAAVLLSTKPGGGIFGAWAPTVGSKVFVRKPDGKEALLAKGMIPASGDTLIIRVEKNLLPYMVELENKPGGRVVSWSGNGPSLIARVIKPVAGVGRFGGTLFQRVGALRANHSGVIDFSTSPEGKIGGFQIIPWDHALHSKEMQGAWDLTQWLIIGPVDGKSMMGGSFPLFCGALAPGPGEGEQLWDLWSTYGRKSLMLVRLNGGSWRKVPSHIGKKNKALKNITHIRIYYPFTDEPQSDFRS
jgi:hypothetical protein